MCSTAARDLGGVHLHARAAVPAQPRPGGRGVPHRPARRHGRSAAAPPRRVIVPAARVRPGHRRRGRRARRRSGTAGAVTTWAWVRRADAQAPARPAVRLGAGAARRRRHRRCSTPSTSPSPDDVRTGMRVQHPLERRAGRATSPTSPASSRRPRRERRPSSRRDGRRARPVHAAAHRPRLRDAGQPDRRPLRRAASSAGAILGQRCPSCSLVFVPPRAFCPMCTVAMGEEHEVEVADRGMVTSFTILTPIQYHGQQEREDYALASILLDGADGTVGQQRLARRAARAGPHGPAGRGGVGRPRTSAAATAAARWASASARPSPAGSPPASPTPTPPPTRSTCCERHRATSPSSRFAQAPASDTPVSDTESQMLFPVVGRGHRAVRARAATRSASPARAAPTTWPAQSFAFVGNLEVTGAWPPISESHVEMDGAWALYEAWVRLQHGDVDTALVFCSGISSRGDLREVLCLQNDPYYLMPLWADHVSLAALQARAVLEATGKARARPRRDRAPAAAAARSATRSPRCSATSPPTTCWPSRTSVAPLRTGDCPPVSDGAAAVVLVAGDRARELCERPAWIRGIDHRIEPHYPGVRDLTVSAVDPPGRRGRRRGRRGRSRWPSCPPRSATRSSCCATRSASATTST